MTANEGLRRGIDRHEKREPIEHGDRCPAPRQNHIEAILPIMGRKETVSNAAIPLRRTMKPSLLARITIEPGKCGGRPCIRGLRIRVTDVLSLLSSGASHQEIIEDYAGLEEADIRAALEYAAVQTDHPILTAA